MEVAKITQQRIEPRVNLANRARTAGVSVNGNSVGAARLSQSNMSIADALRAAYDGDLE